MNPLVPGARPIPAQTAAHEPEPDPEPASGRAAPPARAAVRVSDGTLRYGNRTLWSDLNLDVAPGEFLGVLGPNGAGKSSLLRVLLGQQSLSRGSVLIDGEPAGRGSRRIGFIPQHSTTHANIRARDLVRLGVDGHVWGAFTRRRATRRTTDQLLAAVGATPYAEVPVGMLSGGERQRLRVAQALAAGPSLLLCDEPLASLDAGHQQSVAALIDTERRIRNAAVLFVTHEINPVLPFLDRILYLAPGGHRIGTPQEVLTSRCLSELHGCCVEVMRSEHGVAIFGANTIGGAGGPRC